jgi:ferredoxin
MAKRKIIKINEAKCTGCGLCLPNCPEGAIQIINKKARLISDLFCDGLGACLGHCPEGAITVVEREAEPYDEKKVMANIVKQGKDVVKAHLEHLKGHGELGYLKDAMEYIQENGMEVESGGKPACASKGFSGCPGSRTIDLRGKATNKDDSINPAKATPELSQWPIQINLVSPNASFLKGADLLIAADCVPFAYADFHRNLLKGKILLVGCPKLDDTQSYQEKFTEIIKNSGLKSITYAHMEVPCCFGMISVIQEAIVQSGKKVPFKEVTISIRGERLK